MVEKTTHTLMYLGARIWTAVWVLGFFALVANYQVVHPFIIGLIGMIAGISIIVLYFLIVNSKKG